MSASEKNMLSIEGELTIFEAATLHRRIIGACQAGSLELDLSGVTEVDTAGVQLLEAARREVVARNGVLRLQALSAAVADVLRLSGLEHTFGIDRPQGEQ